MPTGNNVTVLEDQVWFPNWLKKTQNKRVYIQLRGGINLLQWG